MLGGVRPVDAGDPLAPEPCPDAAPRPLDGCFPGEDILDALGTLTHRLGATFKQAAEGADMPPPYLNALRLIDGSISMKELGRRLRCDPSFVTVIADGLEGRGLLRREVDGGDRRIKNLVLTERGRTLRARLDEVFATLPWVVHLDAEERRTLLDLLRRLTLPAGARPGQPA